RRGYWSHHPAAPLPASAGRHVRGFPCPRHGAGIRSLSHLPARFNRRGSGMTQARRIEIRNKTPDRRLEKWVAEAQAWLGVPLESLEEVKVYKVAANDLRAEHMQVFADPVLQDVYDSAA